MKFKSEYVYKLIEFDEFDNYSPVDNYLIIIKNSNINSSSKGYLIENGKINKSKPRNTVNEWKYKELCHYSVFEEKFPEYFI